MKSIVLIGVYFCVMLLIALLSKSKNISVKKFNVADGNAGLVTSALSIAATWIWAPALFTSAEKAYTTGISGLFWFLVPNVLCLILFAPFASKMRKQFPEGMTLAGYMMNTYKSKKVRNVYLAQLSALSVLSTAVQLLAGGKVISMVTNIPYMAVVIVLAVIGVSCAIFSGIKGSIATDSFQFIFIAIVACSIVASLLKTHGMETLYHGLGGISGEYGRLFDSNGRKVFMEFGLSSAIGLISGPFGDQSFWQRAFAVKKDKVKISFIIGALLFSIVPLSIGIVGFIAAGSGYITTDTGNLAFNFVLSSLPEWVIVPFAVMILSGLLSTIDSNMCALSSLATDVSDTAELNIGRMSMIISVLAAVLISFIPNLTVTHLFLFYGTLRASTMLPTVLTLRGVRFTENGIFTGIMLSLFVGLPIFAIGSIADIAVLKVLGSLTALLISGIVAYSMRLKTAKEAAV